MIGLAAARPPVVSDAAACYDGFKGASMPTGREEASLYGECEKCGRHGNGNRYLIYTGKPQVTGDEHTLTDIRPQVTFLCHSCVKAGPRRGYAGALVIFSLLGLLLLIFACPLVAEGAFSIGRYFLFLALMLLAAAAWALHRLIHVKATRESGESVAVRLRLHSLEAKGLTAITASSLPGVVAAHREK